MSAFPTPGMALTHILVVRDIAASRRWYEEVLGARLHREYGGTSAVFDFNGSWLLLVTGGGPTEDKPGLSFAPPGGVAEVDHSFTIRVPDCRGAYETLRSRGATFLTPPHDWGAEVRCFFRDPDGHLFEISEVPTEFVLLEGTEPLEVKGETHYQEALATIAGGKTEEPAQVAVVAILRPEPHNAYDANAVAVIVDGLQVGYLSREVAANYQAAIISLEAERGKPMALNGEIVGGWLRPDGDEGHFGIKLYHDPADF